MEDKKILMSVSLDGRPQVVEVREDGLCKTGDGKWFRLPEEQLEILQVFERRKARLEHLQAAIVPIVDENGDAAKIEEYIEPPEDALVSDFMMPGAVSMKDIDKMLADFRTGHPAEEDESQQPHANNVTFSQAVEAAKTSDIGGAETPKEAVSEEVKEPEIPAAEEAVEVPADVSGIEEDALNDIKQSSALAKEEPEPQPKKLSRAELKRQEKEKQAAEKAKQKAEKEAARKAREEAQLEARRKEREAKEQAAREKHEAKLRAANKKQVSKPEEPKTTQGNAEAAETAPKKTVYTPKQQQKTVYTAKHERVASGEKKKHPVGLVLLIVVLVVILIFLVGMVLGQSSALKEAIHGNQGAGTSISTPAELPESTPEPTPEPTPTPEPPQPVVPQIQIIVDATEGSNVTGEIGANPNIDVESPESADESVSEEVSETTTETNSKDAGGENAQPAKQNTDEAKSGSENIAKGDDAQ